MPKNEMISILTPVMNGERHIQACMENVIGQKCSGIEHIILDGNSNDRTVEIVKDYAVKHPHIRWISEKDKGQSDAMNKGLGMACGSIIGVLNVDDFYERGTLTRVKDVFESVSEPGFIVGNCKVWDDKGNLSYVNTPDKLKITDLLLGWRVHPHPVNPAAYFYHKSLHDIIGPYDENDHFAMDLDFILKAVQVSSVKYFNETWGNYRLLEGTKTVTEQNEGRCNTRVSELFKRHRKTLPLLLQGWIVARSINCSIKRGLLKWLFPIKKVLLG